jgi:hypothetical protein
MRAVDHRFAPSKSALTSACSKIIFQRQFADLGVQCFQVHRRPRGMVAAERLGRTFQQLVLPLRELVRVDVKWFGKLRQGFSPLMAASATLALNSGE